MLFHNEMVGILIAMVIPLPDHRFLCYLPSVLATATILHIINEIEPCNFLEYQNELLSVLKINKVLMNNTDECLNVSDFLLHCLKLWPAETCYIFTESSR